MIRPAVSSCISCVFLKLQSCKLAVAANLLHQNGTCGIAISGQKIGRLVTVAYMAMLRISTKLRKLMESHKTRWVPVDGLPELAFDHRDIIDLALERIRSSVKKEPALIYDMLPAKFTALQLRRLNEEIHGKPMDVRNFHKKIASRPYIVPLDEKEEGVAHRAARYYRFDRKIYNRLYYRS